MYSTPNFLLLLLLKYILEPGSTENGCRSNRGNKVTPSLTIPERTLPHALPLIISTQDSWNPHSCKLETTKTDTLELLRSIDKPLLTCPVVEGITNLKTTTYTFVKENEAKHDFKLSITTMLGIMAATVLLNLLLSHITVPLFAIVTPTAAVTGSTKGDVTVNSCF